jgi:hypothetical protein
MPYTLQDLVRDTIDELVKTHPDEILEKLPVEKRLAGLSPAERLKGLSADEIATLEELLRKLKADGTSTAN